MTDSKGALDVNCQSAAKTVLRDDARAPGCDLERPPIRRRSRSQDFGGASSPRSPTFRRAHAGGTTTAIRDPDAIVPKPVNWNAEINGWQTRRIFPRVRSDHRLAEKRDGSGVVPRDGKNGYSFTKWSVLAFFSFPRGYFVHTIRSDSTSTIRCSGFIREMSAL